MSLILSLTTTVSNILHSLFESPLVVDMAQDEKSHHLQDPVPTEKHEFAQLQVQEHDEESVPFSSETEQRPLDRDQSSASLPTPVTTPSKPQRTKIPAAAIIPVWIVLSSAVILYNNRVYNTYGFRYPVFLVTWHLTCAVSLYLLPLLPPSNMFMR